MNKYCYLSGRVNMKVPQAPAAPVGLADACTRHCIKQQYVCQLWRAVPVTRLSIWQQQLR